MFGCLTRRLCLVSPQLFHAGLKKYTKDSWNQVDLLVFALYLGGLGTRVADLCDAESQYLAKVVYAINAVPLFFKLTRFYASSESLGPLVC